MNLNSPWKALLWEELYVGGSIVAVVLGVCALVAFSLGTLAPVPLDWRDVDILCYIVVYITSVLLLLQIGNSGEMHIGFPRRLLSLPVPSYLLVTVSLFARLSLILLLTVLSRIIVTFGLLIHITDHFANGWNNSHLYDFSKIFLLDTSFFIPIIFPCIIHSFVYVTFQFLCWLFIVFPLSTGLILFLTMFTGVLLLIADYEGVFISLSIFFGSLPSTDSVSGTKLNWLLFFFSIFLYLFLIWFLSIKLVTNTRSQFHARLERVFDFISSAPFLNRWDSSVIIKKFQNGGIAQLWYYLRGNGLIIPLWTFLIWSFLAVSFALILLIMAHNAKQTEYLFRYYQFNYPNAVFFVFPLVALLLSGVVWYLKVTRKMKRDLRAGVFQLSHIPITRKERVYAYWLAGNINLFITLPIIWLVMFSYLCWMFKSYILPEPNQPGMDLLLQQLPFRDMATFIPAFLTFVSGVVMLTGLITWLIMFNPSSIFIISILLLIIISPWIKTLSTFFRVINEIIFEGVQFILYLLGIDGLFPSSCSSLSCLFPGFPIYDIIFYAIYLIYILNFAFYLYIALRAQLLGKKEQVAIFSIFFVIFIFCMPWTVLKNSPSTLLGTYMFLSSVISVAWLKILLQFHGFRWEYNYKTLLKNIRLEAGMEDKVTHLLIGYFVPFVFTMLLLVPHFYTGSFGKTIAYFRENSLPTTLKEMNDKYHSVPLAENLAMKYNELIPLQKKVLEEEGKYTNEYYNKISEELSTEEEKECLKRFLYDYYKAFARKDKPLPEIVYRTYKEFRENVYKNLTEELYKVSESGLQGGDYPIDMTKAYETELPHLAPLRDFVRKLGLEAILYSIDGEYENMLRALRTSASIFKSLENEPILISQLVRIAIFGITYDNIEWILNHKELPEDVLIKLNDIIQSFAIPKEKRSIYNDSLHMELLSAMSILPRYQRGTSIAQINYWDTYLLYTRFRGTIRAWLSVVELCYPTDIEQLLTTNMFTALRKSFNEVARAENLDLPLYRALNQYSDNLLELKGKNFFDATLPYGLYPSLLIIYPPANRSVEAELRHYTFVNLAQTAIAIERFRMKNHRLPEDLQELVPEYLPSIPRDPWKNREPIKYVRGDDFAFKIYSIGRDREDDGGISVDRKKGIRNINEGDFVFAIVPLSVRQQPDVTSNTDLVKLCNELDM